jgi:vitamin-K-epoxide reductase (warfarin-sensitive)
MRLLVVLLALSGLVVSALALRVHTSTDIQPCDINAHWDCGVVNHSRFAEFHGVPVAWFGIVGYAALAALAFFRRPRELAVAATLGCAYALYLTRIEARVLEVWCLYCVISQALIALIMLLAWFLAWTKGSRRSTA